MPDCQHRWKMTNIEFGFIAFERCSHCKAVRTFLSTGDSPTSDDVYREGECLWSRVENAQSFIFDLRCEKCGHTEPFQDLMGLFYCTDCLAECQIEAIQRKLETEKTWVLVAFGHLPRSETTTFPPGKLEMLTDYFNQRRDTSRSRIRIVSFDLIDDFSVCKGEFIHDVGLLSLEAPQERQPLL